MIADSYSAKVELRLVIGDMTVKLSHVGDRDLIVRGNCPVMPPGEAFLHIAVDDSRVVQPIYLPNGIPGPSLPVAYF